MFLFRKTTTHTHTQRTPLPSHTKTYASALALLHNASFIITRSPLVKAHRLLSFSAPPGPIADAVEDDDGRDKDKDNVEHDGGGYMTIDGEYTYEITDHIPLLPSPLTSVWNPSTAVVFTAVFTPRADGLDTFVRAPAGTRIRAEYRVVSSSTTAPVSGSASAAASSGASASASGRGVGATDTATDTDEGGGGEMEMEVENEGKEASFFLVETAELECHWALYPLILSSMAASHAKLHAAFVDRLREMLASDSSSSTSTSHD